jgi:hypothetical protein
MVKNLYPLKDRRNIGRVSFPIETLMASRELSSCCAGQEAMLEQSRDIELKGDEDRYKMTGGN